jgi:uncharacterized membrane protein
MRIGPLEIGLFLIILVFTGVGIAATVKFFVNSSKKPKSSIRILQDRYAKGEITKEQFEQMKKELS